MERYHWLEVSDCKAPIEITEPCARELVSAGVIECFSSVEMENVGIYSYHFINK